MATCHVKPVVDDNVAREIILKEKPTYTVDYSKVGEEPLDGETLFYITYRFYPQHGVAGNNLFANLTEEQDKADAGNCRPLGRYHIWEMEVVWQLQPQQKQMFTNGHLVVINV